MAPEFKRIPGALPPKGSEFSPRIIEELGRYIDPNKCEEVYSKTLKLIEQKITRRILSQDLEPIDIVSSALIRIATTLDQSGRLHTDYEVGATKLVASAARRTGSNWPKKLADEIVTTYLGEGPDGTRIGAMKLSKRAASGGRA